MSGEIRITLDEIVCHFAELEDPRSEINRRHSLESVIVIALMAVLGGAGGPTAIAQWALFKEDFLRKLLPLPNGVPRKDVFRRVLCALQPDVFQACFANWLQSLRDKAAVAQGIDQPVYAIDGKTLRRSHDQAKGLGALHSVSVWASEFGLSLGQVATEEKSNEITAIPEVLKLVNIRGAIVTIDAMGTQKAIAKAIVDGGGDFVLALKGNQEKLHDAVIEYVNLTFRSSRFNYPRISGGLPGGRRSCGSRRGALAPHGCAVELSARLRAWQCPVRPAQQFCGGL